MSKRKANAEMEGGREAHVRRPACTALAVLQPTPEKNKKTRPELFLREYTRNHSCPRFYIFLLASVTKKRQLHNTLRC